MQAGKRLVSKPERGSGSETSKRPGYEANKCLEVNLLGYEMVILDLVLV